MSLQFDHRNQCPACGNNQNTELYRKPYSSEILKNYLHDFYSEQGNYDYSKIEVANFVLAQCDSCTCVYQTEIPNDELMNELYEIWLDPDQTFQIFEKNYRLDYYISHTLKIYRFLRLINKPPKQITVLDFGMGWGNWLQIVKALGCNVYGSELSSKRIAHATANGITNLDLSDIANHKFDFINTDQVFEHVPNPLNILKKLVLSLKEDGYIRISVPDGNDIHRLLSIMDWNASKGSVNSLNVVAPLEHINCFSTLSILKMAATVGLEPEYIPDYPRIDETIAPLQKIDKINLIKSTTISLFKDTLRPIYSKLVNRGKKKIIFKGTDLLFKIKK